MPMQRRVMHNIILGILVFIISFRSISTVSQNLQKSAIITEITMLTHFCTIFFFATKYISKNNNTLCIISSALQRCVIFFLKVIFMS